MSQSTAQETYLRVGIDGTGAASGARVVQRSLDDISSSAGNTISQVSRLKDVVVGAVAAFAGWKASELIKDTTMLAARVETLGVVMGAVGKNLGYTNSQMQGYAKGVAAMGITTEASRQSVIRMGQASLDLAESQNLARIAQNAAVIANTNSSDAFDKMILGMSTGQAIILHHMGLMVNFEKGYQNLAKSLGKSTEALTEEEKAQARLLEVKRSAVNIDGAYAASMTTAGKAVQSLNRFTQELKLSMGEVFLPTLTAAVFAFTDGLKYVSAHVNDIKSAAGALVAIGLTVYFARLAETVATAVSAEVAYQRAVLSGAAVTLGSAEAKAQQAGATLAATQATASDTAAKVEAIKVGMAYQAEAVAAAEAQVQTVTGIVAEAAARRELIVAQATQASILATLTTAEAANLEAQAALTTATSAHTAALGAATLGGRVLTGVMGGLKAAMALVGGEIGLIVIAVTAATYAWVKYSEAAAEAQDQKNKRSADTTTARLVQENKELEKSIKLMSQTPEQKVQESATRQAMEMVTWKKEELELTQKIADSKERNASSIYEDKETPVLEHRLWLVQRELEYAPKLYEEQKRLLEQQATLQKAQHTHQDEEENKKYLAAERSLNEAILQSDLDLLKKEGELKLDQLEFNNSRGLVTIQDYYARRYQLVDEATTAELALISARENEMEAAAASAKDPVEKLKYEKELVELTKKANDVTMSFNKEVQKMGNDQLKATEDQERAVNSVLDANQRLRSEYLSLIGVRKEYVALQDEIYTASRKEQDLALEITKSVGDPLRKQALEQQLYLERGVTAEKQDQLRLQLAVSLQNDQFFLKQQQVNLLKQQGHEKEAFDQQKSLDLDKLQFDFQAKMIGYQKQLNAVRELGLENEADLVRQNMALYMELYQQNQVDIQNRPMSSSTPTGAVGGTSTTNWSGLNGTYTRPVGVAGTIDGSAATAAAQQAAEAWQRAQEAARSLADDLSVRVLRVKGLENEATLQALRLDQQEELNRALSAGVDTTALLIVQQLEYNKTVLEMQEEANENAASAQYAYLQAKAAAEGTYYGEGLDLLRHTEEEAVKLFETTRNKLEEIISDYADSVSEALSQVADAIRSLRGIAADLRASAGRVGGSLASPESSYLSARLEYTQLANLALSGDTAALGKLGGSAERFIGASQSYYASGPQAATDAASVQSVLAQAAAVADGLADALTPQETLLTQQLEVLGAIRDAIKIDSVSELQKQVVALNVNNDKLTSTNTSLSSVSLNTGNTASNVLSQLTALTTLGTKTDAVRTSVTDYATTYISKTDASKAVLDSVALSASAEATKAATIATNTAAISTVAANTGSSGSTAVSHLNSIDAKTKLLKGVFVTRQAGTYTSGTAWETLDTTYTYYKKGGYYPGGSAIMGEEGPELVDSSPGYVYTAQQTKRILERATSPQEDNHETIIELRAQTRELKALVRVGAISGQELLRELKRLSAELAEIRAKAQLDASAPGRAA